MFTMVVIPDRSASAHPSAWRGAGAVVAFQIIPDSDADEGRGDLVDPVHEGESSLDPFSRFCRKWWWVSIRPGSTALRRASMVLRPGIMTRQLSADPRPRSGPVDGQGAVVEDGLAGIHGDERAMLDQEIHYGGFLGYAVTIAAPLAVSEKLLRLFHIPRLQGQYA